MSTTQPSESSLVFISYSSRDRAVADSVRSHLQSHDITCWMAPHDILGGSDWTTAIVDAIDASQALLLLLSEASNVSDEVKREVGRASHRGVPIVPFFIESVVLSKHMEYFLATTHWLGADARHVELRMAHLVDTVRGLLKGPASAAAHAARASGGTAAPSPTAAHASTTPLPAEILRLERLFLDATRPFLRFPPADERPGKGPRPTLAAGAALVVGGLGVLFNLQSLIGVVVPGTGPESFVYVMFPLVRLISLPAVLASGVGNVGLLAGGHRMLSGSADGIGITAAAARWLALVLGTWLIATVLVTLMTGPETMRGAVLNGTLSTAMLAAVQIAVVWKLASMASASATA